MSSRKKTPLTLREYTRVNARKDCPVCQLPEPILEQVRTAGKQKINLAIVSDWLREECGIKLTHEQLLTHQRAGHNVNP